QNSGAEPSWLLMANARRFENYAGLAYTTRFESITRKAGCSVGGIIKCAASKKIAACGSTPFWLAKVWQTSALRRGSIAKCEAEKTLPITRLSGRSFKTSCHSRAKSRDPMEVV